MKKSWIENIIAGSYAIALHIVAIILLVLGLGPSEEKPAPPMVDIIQATVLDEEVFDQQVEKRLQIEQEKKQQEIRQREMEQELKRKEEERLAKLEQERLEKERKLKEEQERLAAEEKKRKAEAEKKKKAEEERKRKEEAERKEQERKAAEEKRKQEAERKRREEEQLLKEALAAEEREREDKRVADIVGQYSAIIKQQVKRNWTKPVSTQSGLQCTLLVELLPGGDVRNVSVVKSSGDEYFDRSAQNAVYKAAPLSVPTDVKAAAEFRRFQFIFKPE
jgi:colicin import membrane protein